MGADTAQAERSDWKASAIREPRRNVAKALEESPHEAASQKATALRRIRGFGDNFAAVLVGGVPYRPCGSRKQLG